MRDLTSIYTERFNVVLQRLDEKLCEFLLEVFESHEFVARIFTRPKKIASFLKKAEQQDDAGNAKYKDPLTEIQDQLGALVITRFLSDIPRVERLIDSTFRRIEISAKEPQSAAEFGYIGKHYVLFLPTDITTHFQNEDHPVFFELQIKTLFQYAWSETNHKLFYKNKSDLSTDQKRRMAFVAAQAWGADVLIDEMKIDLASQRSD